MQPSHGHGDHTQYEGQAEATAGVGSHMFQAASQTSGRTTPRRQILTLEEPADRAASIAARNLSPLVSPSSIGMYSSCLTGASQLKSACAWLTQPLGSAQIPWSAYSSPRNEPRDHLDPLRVVVGNQTPQARWPRDGLGVTVVSGHPVGPIVRLYVHRSHGQESIVALYARVVLCELPDDGLDLYRLGRSRSEVHAEMLAANGQHCQQR